MTRVRAFGGNARSPLSTTPATSSRIGLAISIEVRMKVLPNSVALQETRATGFREETSVEADTIRALARRDGARAAAARRANRQRARTSPRPRRSLNVRATHRTTARLVR